MVAVVKALHWRTPINKSADWAHRFRAAARDLKPHPQVHPLIERAMRDSYVYQAIELERDALTYGLGIARDGQRVDPRNFYARPENDPMNITLRMTPTANGWLVDTDGSERLHSFDRPPTAAHYDSFAAACAALTGHAIEAKLDAEELLRRYSDERQHAEGQKMRAYHADTTRPGANEHGIGPDVGGGPNPDYSLTPEEESARAAGEPLPAFTIGKGFDPAAPHAPATYDGADD